MSPQGQTWADSQSYWQQDWVIEAAQRDAQAAAEQLDRQAFEERAAAVNTPARQAYYQRPSVIAHAQQQSAFNNAQADRDAAARTAAEQAALYQQLLPILDTTTGAGAMTRVMVGNSPEHDRLANMLETV